MPETLVDEDADPRGHSIAYEQITTGKTIRRRWIPWAKVCDYRLHDTMADRVAEIAAGLFADQDP